MKINFKKVECIVDFDGRTETFDVAKKIGNLMMFDGSRILDIGFEDLARIIYYADEEVEVPEQYLHFIWAVAEESTLKACIKRRLKELLNAK